MNKGFFVFLTCILMFCSGVHAQKLNLATTDWEPIYGRSLPEQGFFSAISKAVFKRAGYDITIQFLPWKRALEGARSGKYDGLLGAYHSKDRARNFYYPEPLYASDEVFVQYKGKGITYATVEDLKGYSIGGMRGAANLVDLKKQGFDIRETANDEQSLMKLNSNRVDLVLMGRPQVLFMLENNANIKKMASHVDIIEPPYKSSNLYCPITKKRMDGKFIVNKFNEALTAMKADGSYAAILKRFGQ